MHGKGIDATQTWRGTPVIGANPTRTPKTAARRVDLQRPAHQSGRRLLSHPPTRSMNCPLAEIVLCIG